MNRDRKWQKWRDRKEIGWEENRYGFEIEIEISLLAMSVCHFVTNSREKKKQDRDMDRLYETMNTTIVNEWNNKSFDWYCNVLHYCDINWCINRKLIFSNFFPTSPNKFYEN